MCIDTHLENGSVTFSSVGLYRCHGTRLHRHVSPANCRLRLDGACRRRNDRSGDEQHAAQNQDHRVLGFASAVTITRLPQAGDALVMAVGKEGVGRQVRDALLAMVLSFLLGSSDGDLF